MSNHNRNAHPESNEHYPNFRFEILDYPPEDWELYDIPDKTHLRNRALDLGTYKRLVQYHSWGFDSTISERKTKDRLLQRLKRIVYNQDPNLRPSWHAFVSRNCDAGPRLLKRKYSALQISRWYPDGVPGQPLRFGPAHAPWAGGLGLSNMQGAPAGPQAIIQPHRGLQGQHYQGYDVGNVAAGPSPMPGGSPGWSALPSHQQSMNTAPPGQLSQQSFPATTLPPGHGGYNAGPTGTNHPAFLSSGPVASSGIAQMQQQDQIVPTATPTFSTPASDVLSLPTPQSVRMSDATPVLQQQAMTQILEQPVAASGTSVAQTLPETSQGLRSTSMPPTTSSFPSYSPIIPAVGPRVDPHVRVSVLGEVPKFVYSPYGTSYPCRGRGPVSKGISDAVDCVIVAGMVLDLRRLTGRESRPDGTLRQYSPEDAYIDVSSLLWGSFSEEYSVQRALEFRNICREHLRTANPYRAYDPSFTSLTLPNVWSVCTSSFRQFQVQYTETIRPCSCQGSREPTRTSQSPTYITTDALNDNPFHAADLDTSIRRFFQFELSVPCHLCPSAGQYIRRRQFAALPQTLVIRPDHRVRFRSHSSEMVTIEYADCQSRRLQKATYRWLGGIYPVADEQRVVHKVFWNDRDGRSGGEVDAGALRVYDAGQISGTIVGGFHLANGSERVPTSWWAPDTSPLLFYERVAGPSPLEGDAPLQQNVAIVSTLNTGHHLPGQGQATQSQLTTTQESSLLGQGPRSSQSVQTNLPSSAVSYSIKPSHGTQSYLNTEPSSRQDSESHSEAIASNTMPPQPTEPSALSPSPEQSSSNDSSPLSDSDMGGLPLTEDTPPTTDLLSDSSSALPSFPDLGSLPSSDMDWITDAAADSALFPSLEAGLGCDNNDLPASTSVDAIPAQSSHASEPAAPQATASADQVSGIGSNGNYSADDALCGFDFGAATATTTAEAVPTEYNIFDEILNLDGGATLPGDTDTSLPPFVSGSEAGPSTTFPDTTGLGDQSESNREEHHRPTTASKRKSEHDDTAQKRARM